MYKNRRKRKVFDGMSMLNWEGALRGGLVGNNRNKFTKKQSNTRTTQTQEDLRHSLGTSENPSKWIVVEGLCVGTTGRYTDTQVKVKEHRGPNMFRE